ncbi:MAG: Gfo/Idh/MocA family oxidoreductase [Fidelibacterota bacterium]
MKNNLPKIGIIGVGHLGNHHVKHLTNHNECRFMGIYDIDKDRSNIIAKEYGTFVFDSISQLVENCDGISIVTPTRAHAAVAEECIRAGKHVFIEKPITKTVDEADHLLQLAEENNVIIQVGHIERLNPALIPLKNFDLQPKYIEVQRLAPYTARGTDVPVILDLMIHDIDIILSLVQSSVKNIRASGVSILSDSVDIANARIRFENGTVASITSSRIARDKVRKIKIFQKDMYVTIDFLLGLTEIYRVLDENIDNPAAIQTAPLDSYGIPRKIVYEKPEVSKIDALELELTNFIASIQGKETPIVNGHAGREALDVAVKIHDLILEDIH